jgi:hypothetical protein
MLTNVRSSTMSWATGTVSCLPREKIKANLGIFRTSLLHRVQLEELSSVINSDQIGPPAYSVWTLAATSISEPVPHDCPPIPHLPPPSPPNIPTLLSPPLLPHD